MIQRTAEFLRLIFQLNSTRIPQTCLSKKHKKSNKKYSRYGKNINLKKRAHYFRIQLVPGSTGVNKAQQENDEFEWEKTRDNTIKKTEKNAGAVHERARRQNKDARKRKELHNFPKKVEQPATTYLIGVGGLHFGTVNSAPPLQQTKCAKKKKTRKCAEPMDRQSRGENAPRQDGFRLWAK